MKNSINLTLEETKDVDNVKQPTKSANLTSNNGFIIIPVEEIEQQKLSDHRYLFISTAEGDSYDTTFISAPPASKRTSTDEYFIKSILAYKNLFESPEENTSGTVEHFVIMYNLCQFNDGSVDKQSFFKSLKEIFVGKDPRSGEEIMKSMNYVEWKNVGANHMEQTEKFHHVVVQINEFH